MDVRGLVADLQENANPLERISISLIHNTQDFLTARELGVLLLRSLAMSNVHQKETLLVADLQMIHISVI